MNKEIIIEAFKEVLPLLGLYDYLFFAASLLFFLITIFLASVIKNGIVSFFLVLFGLILLLISPIIIPTILDKTIRKTELNITTSKKLQFSDTALIVGEIKNVGKVELKLCYIYIRVCKKAPNPIKEFANCLKPLAKGTKVIQEPLDINDSIEFSMAFDDFSYQKEFITSIYVKCY